MNRTATLLALAAGLTAPATGLAQTQPETAPAHATEQAPTAPAPGAPGAPSPEVTVAKPTDEKLLFKGLQLKMSGVIFAFWGYDLDNANPDAPSPDGANRFEITRAYINVEPHVSDKIWLRITPDITRVSGTEGNIDGNLDLRLKYAYAQFDDVGLKGLSIKGGLQQTAYIDFEDSVWGYRVLNNSAYEFFTGNSSSDLGVGAIGKHLDGLLEYQLVLSNGEGYTRPERSGRDAGKYKDLGARVTIAPFATAPSKLINSLKVTGFAQYGILQKVADRDLERIRTLATLTWQPEFLTLGVSAGPTWEDVVLGDGTVDRQNGVLFSSFGWVNLPLNLRALARYDWYDANLDSSPDEDPADTTPGSRSRVIAGLAYRFNDMVQVIGDYQFFGYEKPENLPDSVVGEALFVHLEAKY